MKTRTLSRRQFLAGSAAGLAALGLSRRTGFAKTGPLPKPDKSGIRHIIVAMVENRSFDHLLGWHPNADAMQAGLVYYDAAGVPHSTWSLAPDYQGCAYGDPDHSWEGGRIELNGGACDGWLLANDIYSIGYYRQQDLPFLGKAALDWTLCDRYFSAIMAATYPNRFYQHCGVTDRLDDSLTPSTLPTIWDRLAAAHVPHKYYFSDVPFLGFWGTKYAGITRPYSEFLADCAAGTLPAVSFVDPRFGGEDQGVSGDYHPHGDIRTGEHWLYQTYRAITTSPAWKHTVLVINFDEWGGFFDHIAPNEAPDVDPRFKLRGFRVPAIVVSPFARRGYVDSTEFDHTSILKMIEWRWGLAPLSVRDQYANNLASVLDFSTVNRVAPDYSVPDVASALCPIL
ncbi:MAG TPA: alkaline phosphatase family protein [Kofleriaceae bacterium]|nr:alkaline phosphatase family protein [Kofleriaceae bacterium]